MGSGFGICIHTIFYLGATAIIQPTFKATEFGNLLKKYEPNIIAGVPTLYEALLNSKQKKLDLSFVTCCVSGGDKLSIDLKHRVDKFLKEHNSKTEIREGYGLTECVTASCLTPIGDYREGSIGIPYPDIYYKIVKIGTCDEVPLHEDGEIVLTGTTVMKRIFKK